MFDHVVDNVGKETRLYYKAHEYMRPGAVFINIAGEPTSEVSVELDDDEGLAGVLGWGEEED